MALQVPLLRVLQRTALLLLVSSLILRAVLTFTLTPQVDPSMLPLIFAVGLGRDLLVTAAVAVGLLGAAIVGRRMLLWVLVLVSALVIVLFAAEWFFWSEFQSRPDRLVFHYLAYPTEVLTFLQDQFLIAVLLVPFVALSAMLHAWLRKPLGLPGSERLQVTTGGAILAGLLALSGLGLTMLAPNLSGRIPEQLASNAIFGIGAAALTDVSRWQDHYPASDSAATLPPFLSQQPWSQPPKHLVLIIQESFAGPTWQDPALRAQYLPEFSALANRGWYFSNGFATGSRTTRGMEALLNGMPPLPGVATSQRANPERLPSLPRALAGAGWHSVFVYAGWPDFSDLTSYWQAIGFDHSTSREDFDPGAQPFETSWGYADEFLFERVLQEMNTRTAQHNQVFLSTLTVSHHRPFDYPAGRIDLPADERRSEYAMAYADWALGQFMRRAANTDWYEETLFVIAADHGARFQGNASIPINSYRVPIVFYAPGRTQPRELEHLVSLMEVPGTVLDLLAIAHRERFYGTHMLDASTSLVPVEHDYDVGLIHPEGVTVLRRQLAPESWHWQAANSDLIRSSTNHVMRSRVARLFQQAHERYFGESQ